MAKGPGRRRILVAEDEEAIAALIQYNLETAGYGVTILSDGDKALEEAKADPPQAMLLDWNLQVNQACKSANLPVKTAVCAKPPS